MSENPTIEVKFTSLSETTRTLTITVNGKGTVMVMPKKEIYNVGESVSLYAVPATGHKFDGWTGSITSMDNPVTFVFT